MKWTRMFVNVSCGALAGMVMGGSFGFLAGSLAPRFFAHLIPWNDVEPTGIAIILGAVAGVLLGGVLATLGVVLQIFLERKKP